MESTLQNLSDVIEGTTVILGHIIGEPLFKKRLTELGFIAGEEILVLHNIGHGSLIVNIKGAKFALGRSEADKIFISEKRLGQ